MISYLSWLAFLLCHMMLYYDVVGLYPNIPHNEGLLAMRKALDLRKDRRISTESLI